MDGFLNILKPSGISSTNVVTIIKKILKVKKIGHAGTLDPLASGVLTIMLGRATKCFDFLQELPKEYIFELQFGVITDTLDNEGTITNRCSKEISDDMIDNALSNFKGEIEQIPPSYSALKIAGKKMYELARSGIDFEIKSRKTNLYDIKRISDINNNKVKFYIKCSSGFYVRSLCRDIANSLGTVGNMSYLLRVSAHGFDINESLDLESLCNDESVIKEKILSLDKPFISLDRIDVNKSDYFKLFNGQSLLTDKISGRYRIYYSDNFIGIAKIKNNYLKIDILLNLKNENI